ncbi:Uncharacterised protein [Vibrio cholerae]|nr:Uncharacterised protein [Vibrio cholerae]
MLSTRQVQGFVTCNQFDDFRVTFHQFTFCKRERAGKAYIEANRLQCID